MRVAIIGMGVVGQAQAAMFCGHEAVTWDAADGTLYPWSRIARCDFAVICTGTPAAPGGSADLSSVHDAFAALPSALPVLLRSTVPPGTTAALLAADTGRLICHAPEFLYESGTGPWRKSTDVPWVLLGGEREARGFFRRHLERVFPGVIHECSALTAELAKYTANLYWAARVTFVNEMAAVCEATGGDWEEVRAAWLEDRRVNPAYTAMAGFGPGFGGRCWPKDLSALIAASEDAGYPPLFLESVRDANARFRP